MPSSDRDAIEEDLLRNHSDRSQPRIYQPRPCRNRKLRAPQPERMAALRIQMHLHGNAGVLERDIVRQRIVYVVHVVILGLQQERRRRLAGDMEIGVQRKISIGVRRMRNHKLLDALVRIPLRRGQLQMARINSHRKIGATALSVGRIYSRIQTVIKMVANRCYQMPS